VSESLAASRRQIGTLAMRTWTFTPIIPKAVSFRSPSIGWR
jgi:hypothetical protein